MEKGGERLAQRAGGKAALAAWMGQPRVGSLGFRGNRTGLAGARLWLVSRGQLSLTGHVVAMQPSH